MTSLTEKFKLIAPFNYVFLIFLIFPLLVYLPAFLTEFGIANDYLFLPGNFKDHKIFLEAERAYAIGRPALYYLLTFQGWCIEKISDLTVVRIILFLFMLSFTFLFYLFLRRRLGVEVFWSGVIALVMMMLPTSELHVLWVAHFPSGFFTLFLAMVSYLLLDSITLREWRISFQHKVRLMSILIGSAFIFLLALFTYPVNAVFVFVCTFSILFFSPLIKWRQTLRMILRDMAFYGICILIYYITIVFYFFPHAPVVLENLGGNRYDFNVTFSLWQKAKLIIETFMAALGGVGHTMFGHFGVMIGAIMIILSLGGFLYLRKRNMSGPGTEKKSDILYLFVMFCLGMILFLLANSPAIMAKECFYVIGYRVLFPASTMILICQCGLWQKCTHLLKSRKAILFIKVSAVGFVFCTSLIASINVADASRKFGC